MKILFVCTGNTCRSPMAAAMFQRIAEEESLPLSITSAGISALEGQPASSGAAEACREIGISLEGHRSHRLNGQELTEADLIVTVSPTHAYILEQAGAPREKIYLLGDIRDPFGGDTDAYRVCRDQIAAGLGELKILLKNRCGLRIVPFREEFLDGAARLEETCFAVPWSRNLLETTFHNREKSEFFAALWGGRFVGYAGLDFVLDEGSMLNVAVFPEFRGRGIGRALVRALKQRCLERKLSFLTLEVRQSNEAAIRLYESEGFSKVGQIPRYYHKPVEDALLMTWFTADNKES